MGTHCHLKFPVICSLLKQGWLVLNLVRISTSTRDHCISSVLSVENMREK